jgi:hypothetical protein
VTLKGAVDLSQFLDDYAIMTPPRSNGLYDAGLMVPATLREIEFLCLPPVERDGEADIRPICVDNWTRIEGAVPGRPVIQK